MTQEKFIELLNLYVDGRLSPAEAAALEGEIQTHPERRRIYREYCQIARACALLHEQFQPATSAPVERIPALATEATGTFGVRRLAGSWSGLAAGFGGLAAVAAAAAYLMLSGGPGLAPGGNSGLASTTPATAPLATSGLEVARAGDAGSAFRPVATTALPATGLTASLRPLAAMRFTASADAGELAWTENVRPALLSVPDHAAPVEVERWLPAVEAFRVPDELRTDDALPVRFIGVQWER